MRHGQRIAAALCVPTDAHLAFDQLQSAIKNLKSKIFSRV
jgi:hypothetical protein